MDTIVHLLGLLGCAEPERATPPELQAPGPWSVQGAAHDPLPEPLPAPDVAGLAEVMAGVCPEIVPEPPHEGEGLHRVTLSGSPGRCNDGSPPVLYVRRALDPRYEARWVLHLDGGASCEDYESCAERWCGASVYDAADMSSQWAPESIVTHGLLGRNTRNTFRDWNVAQLSYCSSDFWLGTAAERVLEGGPGDVPYLIRFEGDKILTAAMLALAEGVTSDDGTQQMPPLGLANMVLFGGSSAGGYGLGMQLNDVLDTMTDTRPQTRVVAVIDSAFTPSPEVLSAEDVLGLEAAFEADWERRVEGAWAGVVDVRCSEVTEERWRCFDLDHVLRNFVEVPVLVHHDLYDPVYGEFFMGAGLDEKEFFEAGEATLRGYAQRPGMYAHGTTCGEHMSLVRTPTFLDMGPRSPSGPPVTMNQLLQDLLQGGAISAVDSQSAPSSICQ
jgi:hypothetical protein